MASYQKNNVLANCELSTHFYSRVRNPPETDGQADRGTDGRTVKNRNAAYCGAL